MQYDVILRIINEMNFGRGKIKSGAVDETRTRGDLRDRQVL